MQKGSKKPALPIVRPTISNASLNDIPSDLDFLQGFQERLECGVDWTLQEEAARHHRKKCTKEDVPTVTFSDALENTIKQSILRGFLEESNVSLTDQWESLLPMVLWNNENFTNDELVCFTAVNSITDEIYDLIKRTVRFNDRSVLREEFHKVRVLRLIGAKMTTLDQGLAKFKNLNILNLCGNYIDHINTKLLPQGLEILELQSNRIHNVHEMIEDLPNSLTYLGLGRNLIKDETVGGLMKLRHISVLDLSNNDIYSLDIVLNGLVTLPKLTSLMLVGNPCAVCAAYAKTTIARLPQLRWLDSKEIMEADRHVDQFEPHPNDLRSAFFYFTIYRILSVPQPPKLEKGAITTFHVELELPFLDSTRRRFLMYRHNDSLIEYLPSPEDDKSMKEVTISQINAEKIQSGSFTKSDIYNHLVPLSSCKIQHYIVFESNKIPWNKIMSFQEPAVRIFCPNLTGLRDTFRTVVTVRLICSVTQPAPKKQNKTETKSNHSFKQPSELRVTLATVKCALKQPDWWQPIQRFHWVDTFNSEDAKCWGEDDGVLDILQQRLAGAKPNKSKKDSDANQNQPPENLTCYLGFGIDTIT